jgi:hypothetical protein
MAEQEDIGGGRGFVELRELVGEDLALGAVFGGHFERGGVPGSYGVEGEGENGLPFFRGVKGQGQEGDLVARSEGVGLGLDNSDIVGRVGGNHCDFEQAGRAVGSADENVRLAAVTEGVKDVGDGEKIALFVDEESVAEERIPVSVRAGRLV